MRTPADDDMAIVSLLRYSLGWMYLFLFQWSHNADGESLSSKHGCHLISTVANCSHLKLSSIPEDLPNDIEHLFLDYNQIKHLSRNSLKRYNNLINLSLESNSLEVLEQDTFWNTVKLESLSLQNNNIFSNYIRVAEGLTSATSLKWLDLSRNGLTVDMVATLLGKLTSLEYLYLNNNVIMRLDSFTFQGLTSLRELSLEGNYIYEIEPGTFEPLKNLRTLNLAFNLLPCIEDFALTQLKSLNLSFNDIEWFLSREDESDFQLEKLDISHNHLFYFPLLPKHHHLHTLLLSDNEMRFYARHFGANSSLVDFLILVNNTSDIITVDIWEEYIPNDLSNLQIVDLSRNQFDYLPDKLFSKMTSLSHLKLNWNCLKTFDMSHEHISNTLNTLELSNNELSELTLNTSSQSFSELVHLNLSQNDLKTLPRQIISTMPRLDTLDLSQNMIHLCTYVDNFAPSDQPCVDLNNASMKHLRLSDCGLDLDTQIVFQETELTSLDISSNPLKSLGFFKHTASTLKSISLRKSLTLMKGGDFSDFSSLISLDLSENGLTTFPKSLTGLPLRYLDVSNNKLTSIPLSDGYQPLKSSLNTLFLSKNPLDCCEMSWLKPSSSISIPDYKDMTCNFSNNFMSVPDLPEFVLRSCQWTTRGALLSVLIVPTFVTLLVALLLLFLMFKQPVLKAVKRCFRTSPSY